MPTKSVTVCASCGRKDCDGGVWEIVRREQPVPRLLRDPGGPEWEDLTAVFGKRTGCTRSIFGADADRYATHKAVGDEVVVLTLTGPCGRTTIRKVGD